MPSVDAPLLSSQPCCRPSLPGGGHQLVTAGNLEQYIAALTRYKCVASLADEAGAMARGLRGVLTAGVVDTLARCFTHAELNALVAGLGSIDLADWRAHVRYQHCGAGTEQVWLGGVCHASEGLHSLGRIHDVEALPFNGTCSVQPALATACKGPALGERRRTSCRLSATSGATLAAPGGLAVGCSGTSGPGPPRRPAGVCDGRRQPAGRRVCGAAGVQRRTAPLHRRAMRAVCGVWGGWERECAGAPFPLLPAACCLLPAAPALHARASALHSPLHTSLLARLYPCSVPGGR